MSIDHRRIFVVFCLIVAVVAIAAPAFAQYTRYTDIPPGTAPGDPATPGPPGQPVGGLIFYADRTLFTTDFPGLTSEDFLDTLVPPGGVTGCDGPFNSSTNNACFAPGGVEPGIEIDNLQGGQNVVLGTGFLGVPTPAVGPNTFLDDMVIRFNDPGVPVAAFGAEMECPNGATTVDIDVYDSGGLLGSTSTSCGPGGVFWGVASDVLIDRIEFNEPQGGGELIRDALFGAGPVPTMGGWSLLALLVVLALISGLVFYRRRTI